MSVPQIFVVIQFCLLGKSFLSVSIPALPVPTHLISKKGRISKLTWRGTYEVHLKMQRMFANGWGNSVWYSYGLV